VLRTGRMRSRVGGPLGREAAELAMGTRRLSSVGSVRHIFARLSALSSRAPLTDSPLLGYQQARLRRRQLQDIAYFVPAEVDTIDAARQFARKEHTHT
jgi:hypothetical protein